MDTLQFESKIHVRLKAASQVLRTYNSDQSHDPGTSHIMEARMTWCGPVAEFFVMKLWKVELLP